MRVDRVTIDRLWAPAGLPHRGLHLGSMTPSFHVEPAPTLGHRGRPDGHADDTRRNDCQHAPLRWVAMALIASAFDTTRCRRLDRRAGPVDRRGREPTTSTSTYHVVYDFGGRSPLRLPRADDSPSPHTSIDAGRPGDTTR
jgi:hypothetical protein